MTRTITIPSTITVTSRGVAVDIDTALLSDVILAELAMHGLKQKVSDAASQAGSIVKESGGDLAEVTLGLMNKAKAALLAGEWSMRGTASEGVSVEQSIARQIMRQQFKAKVGAKSPQWAKFTGLEPQAQLAKLDEWATANAEAIKPLVDEELRIRAAKAKALKATAVTFDI